MGILSAGLCLVLAALAWAGVAWTVLSVPPTNPVSLATFYLFAFLALAATATLFGWVAIRPHAPDGRLSTPLGLAGHGALFALVTLLSLWLQSLRQLSPTNAVLLAGLYVLLELALVFGTRQADARGQDDASVYA